MKHLNLICACMMCMTALLLPPALRAQIAPADKPAISATADAPALGRMPVINTESLAKRELTLPKDLPGQRTLILMAYARVQQKNIDTWINGMALAKSRIAWIETPIVGERNFLMQAFINGGMRAGIQDPTARENTVTLFVEPDELAKAMGMPSKTSTIFAAVVERSGRVLAYVEGDYTPEKAALISAALAP
jgi:hypothetical protein